MKIWTLSDATLIRMSDLHQRRDLTGFEFGPASTINP